jgi:hypothetical protein
MAGFRGFASIVRKERQKKTKFNKLSIESDQEGKIDNYGS